MPLAEGGALNVDRVVVLAHETGPPRVLDALDRRLDQGSAGVRSERDQVGTTALQGVVDQAVQQEAIARDLHLHRGSRVACPTSASRKRATKPLWAATARVAAEVGAEDVDPAVAPGCGLGVLGLPGVTDGLGAQALYLPTLAYAWCRGGAR